MLPIIFVAAMLVSLAAPVTSNTLCLAYCTGTTLGADGKNHTGQRFMNPDSCNTLSPNCGTQFAGPLADQLLNVCGNSLSESFLFIERQFPDLQTCQDFANNVMARVIPNVNTGTTPPYATNTTAQKDAGCGCQDMVEAFINSAIDMPDAHNFCDYVKGKAADWGTKIVCATSTAEIPILGNLCEMVVGKVAETVTEVAAPAFDPFCNQIVNVANDAFDTDLNQVFVLKDLPKNISQQIASQVCGDYLCPGQVPEVCELRDSAVELASVVCTLMGGAENMAGSCFPARSYVMLENGTRRKMKDLVVGDRVQVGPNRYSEVFYWTHRIPTIKTNFVKIIHQHGVLLVSEDHYVYANHKKMTARSVRIGDILPLHNNQMSVVQNISREHDVGLYNPQTRHGDIVVDGVVVTTYTNIVHPTVARTFLSATELLAAIGVDILGKNVESVRAVPWWAVSLVEWMGKGPELAA